MSSYGFVYLLSNEYMPHVFKIGCSERSPHIRALELSKSTGVPANFDVVCYIEVADPFRIEAELHSLFSDLRISSGREFFYAPLQRNVVEILSAFQFHPEALAMAKKEVFQEFLDFPETGESAELWDVFDQNLRSKAKEQASQIAFESSTEVEAL